VQTKPCLCDVAERFVSTRLTSAPWQVNCPATDLVFDLGEDKRSPFLARSGRRVSSSHEELDLFTYLGSSVMAFPVVGGKFNARSDHLDVLE
jgi:hypothetical protein